ncbi:hypothetical protein N7512_001463 [Penicillium capsulatum]|nr:hypothetical protein N7512_001463 [Penicillium capsulatum]
METRQSARKRRNSSISHSRDESPVSHRTRNGASSEYIAPSTGSATPKKSRKRVRFSDPGPLLQDTEGCSTGLTPAMQRTSFAGVAGSGDRTPSRKARRRSAPTPRFRRSFDPVEPFEEDRSEQRMQFTPLRQILDTRTQRRIRRFGLSDEINHIEREKRNVSSFERTLAQLRHERDTLQQELSTMKQQQSKTDGHWSVESTGMSSQMRIRELENATTSLWDEISVASSRNMNVPASLASNDENTFTLNDSDVIVSNSPDLRAVRHHQLPAPDSIALSNQSGVNVSDQTTVLDNPGDTQTLTIDLQTARNEKRELFDACRSHISIFDHSSLGDTLRQSSPPPDFDENVVNILTTALSRASEATQALEGINIECSNLGFTGNNAKDMVLDMRSHFRSARLELERALPGETADAGLEDGKATLGALVKRVRSLVKDLQTERQYHDGSLGREKALRGQFDNLLYRYEAAANKVGNLEDSIASSAGDMLHTRMRMRDLENEDQEKSLGIDRLNNALTKYREDVKCLEQLVSRLEDENLTAKEDYTRQVSALKKQVIKERQQRSSIEVSVAEYESRIQHLQETVEQNRIRACDLTAEVESLEQEHQRSLDACEQRAREQLQEHEEDAGILNVRISELTTSLESARSEAQRLRQVNAGLETQLQMETDAREEMLDKWATEQARSFSFMKDAVNSERRRAKVRAANWELQSDDLMSDGTAMGSDPITPVSVTRFGKDRRRMDSGIGILTEDEVLEREGLSELRRGLDSDIDLPTSDFMDV